MNRATALERICPNFDDQLPALAPLSGARPLHVRRAQDLAALRQEQHMPITCWLDATFRTNSCNVQLVALDFMCRMLQKENSCSAPQIRTPKGLYEGHLYWTISFSHGGPSFSIGHGWV